MDSIKKKECVKCGVMVPSVPHLMISHWKRFHNEPPKTEFTDAELRKQKAFCRFFNEKVKENPEKFQVKDLTGLVHTEHSDQGIFEKVCNLLKDVSNTTFTDVVMNMSQGKEDTPQEETAVKQEKPKFHFDCEKCGKSFNGLETAVRHFSQHAKEDEEADKALKTNAVGEDTKTSSKNSSSELDESNLFSIEEQSITDDSTEDTVQMSFHNEVTASGNASKITETTGKDNLQNTCNTDTVSLTSHETPIAMSSGGLQKVKDKLHPLDKCRLTNENYISTSTNQSLIRKSGLAEQDGQTCFSVDPGHSSDTALIGRPAVTSVNPVPSMAAKSTSITQKYDAAQRNPSLHHTKSSMRSRESVKKRACPPSKSANPISKSLPPSGLKTFPDLPTKRRHAMSTLSDNTAKIRPKSGNIYTPTTATPKNCEKNYALNKNASNIARKTHKGQTLEKEKKIAIDPQKSVARLSNVVENTKDSKEDPANKNVPLPETTLSNSNTLSSIPSLSQFIQSNTEEDPGVRESSDLGKDIIENVLEADNTESSGERAEIRLESDSPHITRSAVDFASNPKGNATVVKELEKLLMPTPDTITSKTPVWKSKQQREKDAAVENEFSEAQNSNNDELTTTSSDMLVPLPTIIPPPKSSCIRSSYFAAKIVRRISSTQTVAKQQCDQSQVEMVSGEAALTKVGKRKRNLNRSDRSTPNSESLDKVIKKLDAKKLKMSSQTARQRSRSYESPQKSSQTPFHKSKSTRKHRKSSFDDLQQTSTDGHQKVIIHSDNETSNQDEVIFLSSDATPQDDIKISKQPLYKKPSNQAIPLQKGCANPVRKQNSSSLLNSNVTKQVDLSKEISNRRKFTDSHDQPTLEESSTNPRNLLANEANHPISSDKKKDTVCAVIIISSSDDNGSDDDGDGESWGYDPKEWYEARNKQQQEDNSTEKSKDADPTVKTSVDFPPNNTRQDQILNRSSSEEPEMKILTGKSLTSDVSLPDSYRSDESRPTPSLQSDKDNANASDNTGEEISSKSKHCKKHRKKHRKKRRRQNSNASPTSNRSSLCGSDESFNDNLASEEKLRSDLEELFDKNFEFHEKQRILFDQQQPTLNMSPAEHVKLYRRKLPSSNNSKENNRQKESSFDSDNMHPNAPDEKSSFESSKHESIWKKFEWNSTRDPAHKPDSDVERSDNSSPSSQLSQEDFDVTKSTSTNGKSSSYSDSVLEERTAAWDAPTSPDVSDIKSDGAHGRVKGNLEASNLSANDSADLGQSSCSASPDLILAMESGSSITRDFDAVPEHSEEVLPKPEEQTRRRGTARKTILRPPPPRSIKLKQCDYCYTMLPNDSEALSNHRINVCPGLKASRPPS